MNTNGSFTYTPNSNYSGPDSFTYQATDGTASSNAIVVSITVNPVNDNPVAVADTYRVVPDTLLTVSAANGVLKNDTDVDSTNLTANLISSTTHGTLTFSANGGFSYQPTNGFTGTDSFTYTVQDDANPFGLSSAVHVDLIVNSPPIAHDDAYSANEDTPFIHQRPGRADLTTRIQMATRLTAGCLISQLTHGHTRFPYNGSFTYTPDANFVGTDSFRYQVTTASPSSAARNGHDHHQCGE